MNWGHGITIFLILFVSFMATLVYLTTRSTFDLEVEDYYQQELAYQEQITAFSNAREAEATFEIAVEPTQIVIDAPGIASDQISEAQLLLYRPNDSSLDVQMPLTFDGSTCALSTDDLVRGAYEARITWKEGEKSHAIYRKIMIP